MRYKLPNFDVKMDSLAAEDWVQKVEKILNTFMIMDDTERIRLATHQLESEVDQRWREMQETMNTGRLTWQGFKKLFSTNISHLPSEKRRKNLRSSSRCSLPY